MTAADPADATSVAPTGDATPPADSRNPNEERVAQWADAEGHETALTWVDTAAVADHAAVTSLDDDRTPEAGVPVLRGAKRHPKIVSPAVMVPIGIMLGLVATYAGTTLLWPLHEVEPTVQSVQLDAPTAPAAAITWPVQGSAAVGIDGITTASSSLDAAAIASVTKVVSSMMVLDRMPLAVGEQGPEFSFTSTDDLAYWSYRRSDQSALEVPVGGTLTEFQMLQGTLLGSANNYIDRLAKEIWGSDAAFATAAEVWLRERGIEGITIVTPSGFSAANVATPHGLVTLAEKAMQNPVFASIVGTASVDLPGAGTVVNTNGMLGDAGVVGIKTGTLGDSWNLLTAKDVTIDDTTVRLYAAVLGQGDNDQRLAETRSLFTQVESVLQAQEPAVEKGTIVGEVETLWGASVDVITDADADIVLWDAATAQVSSDFDLGNDREAGDEVGELAVVGPLNSVTVTLALADDVEEPSPWWRLTHPLELFGLTASQR